MIRRTNLELSACIVVYNGCDEALKAAQTVLQYTRRHPLTLYLVDNASPDGSGARLEAAVKGGALSTQPGQKVEVRCRKENGGFRPAGADERLPLHPEPGHPAHRRYPQRPGRLDGRPPGCCDGPAGAALPGWPSPEPAAAALCAAAHGLPPAAVFEILGEI